MKQLRYYINIRNNPRKSRKQLARIQSRGLRKTLLSAYENIDFYKHLFDEHDINPESITISTISKVPVLTKEKIRNAGKSILSRKFEENDLVIEETGGSTGKPVIIYNSKDAIASAQAVKLRTYVEHGYKLSQKICTFLFYGPRKKFYHKFGIHRTYAVSPYTPMEEAIPYVQKHKPHVFDGFPSKIAEFARHIKKKNIKGINPVLVFANSETMQEQDKEIIKEQFADPINVYMSREFKVIAWECNLRNGFHVNEDFVFVEIVDPITKKPVPTGQPGEIDITGFFNDAMPLIRFNTEDVGVLSRSPCPCGRTFILLEDVYGRTNDFVVLPSGEKLLGHSYLTNALNNVGLYDKIEQFQGRQRKDGSIDLALNAEDLTQEDEQAILDELEKVLGKMEVRIRPASEIKRTKQGKYRSFSSEIS